MSLNLLVIIFLQISCEKSIVDTYSVISPFARVYRSTILVNVNRKKNYRLSSLLFIVT